MDFFKNAHTHICIYITCICTDMQAGKVGTGTSKNPENLPTYLPNIAQPVSV